jgi:hypothetical protein
MDEQGNMRYLGHPDALKLDEVEARVLVVLGDEWRKTREVRDELGEPHPGQEQLRMALIGLASKGEIERDPPITESAQGRVIQWRRKRAIARNE